MEGKGKEEGEKRKKRENGRRGEKKGEVTSSEEGWEEKVGWRGGGDPLALTESGRGDGSRWSLSIQGTGDREDQQK